MTKPQGTVLTNLFPQFPKIALISDTHNLHEKLSLGKGDLLIHSGDSTDFGSDYEAEAFLKWFAKQDYKHKICIAGNHDFYFQRTSAIERKKRIPENVIYLQNESITIEGIKFFGSPVTPYFHGLAFNERRGKPISKVWQNIPNDTDILITHGPPFGILDNNLGCEELRKYVDRIQPKLHIFGHIHERNGTEQKQSTLFVNAAKATHLF